MGEEINIEKIEVYQDCYQIDIRYKESKKGERLFIKKEDLFSLLTMAEKDHSERVMTSKYP